MVCQLSGFGHQRTGFCQFGPSRLLWCLYHPLALFLMLMIVTTIIMAERSVFNHLALVSFQNGTHRVAVVKIQACEFFLCCIASTFNGIEKLAQPTEHVSGEDVLSRGWDKLESWDPFLSTCRPLYWRAAALYGRPTSGAAACPKQPAQHLHCKRKNLSSIYSPLQLWYFEYILKFKILTYFLLWSEVMPPLHCVKRCQMGFEITER